MTPQQQKIAILVLLLLALGVALWWGFFRGGPASVTGAPSMAGAPGPAIGAPGAPIIPARSQLLENIEIDALLEDMQEVTFDYEEFAKDMRNPMTPLVGERQPLTGGGDEGPRIPRAPEIEILLKNIGLTGIIWDEEYPLAVVDNEVVAPGDKLPNVEGIVVDAVNVDHIVVRIGDASYPVELKEH